MVVVVVAVVTAVVVVVTLAVVVVVVLLVVGATVVADGFAVSVGEHAVRVREARYSPTAARITTRR